MIPVASTSQQPLDLEKPPDHHVRDTKSGKKNGKKNKTMFSDITTDFIRKPSSTHGIM